MQNKKIIIAVILCIGAVISLIYGMTACPGTRRAAPPASLTRLRSQQETLSINEAVPPPMRIIPTKRRAVKTDFVAWRRNPFVPKGVPVSKFLRLTLSGIIWDEKKPRALINDSIVKVGDEINGNTVVVITQDSVILNDGINNFELRLEETREEIR